MLPEAQVGAAESTPFVQDITAWPVIVLSLSQVTVYFAPLAMEAVTGLNDPPEIVGFGQLAAMF